MAYNNNKMEASLSPGFAGSKIWGGRMSSLYLSWVYTVLYRILVHGSVDPERKDSFDVNPKNEFVC